MPLYYLTFQRAPPVTVSPDEQISVSPAIVSDLRDDVYQPEGTPVCICMAWLRQKDDEWVLVSAPERRPWEGPASAYKPYKIRVPDVNALRGSTALRFAFWADDKRPMESSRAAGSESQEWVFDICAMMPFADLQVVVLPVLSAPIKVRYMRGGTSVSTEKSTTTTRFFQLGSGQRAIEICEEAGYELDKVRDANGRAWFNRETNSLPATKHIWDASLHTSWLMCKTALRDKAEGTSPLSLLDDCRRGLQIVELGTWASPGRLFGVEILTWALSQLQEPALDSSLSSFLSCLHSGSRPWIDTTTRKMGQALFISRRPICVSCGRQFEATFLLCSHCTADCTASALPLLERNIALNSHFVRGSNVVVNWEALDWADVSSRQGVQLVLVSDCTYNPVYFEPLCTAICALLTPGSPSSSCLLAKKHRHSDEEGLWSEVDRCGLQYTLHSGEQTVQPGEWGIWTLTRPP